MKNKNKLAPILFFVASACFFAGAFLGRNYYMIPIACCFLVLGIVNGKNGPKDEKKDDQEN